MHTAGKQFVLKATAYLRWMDNVFHCTMDYFQGIDRVTEPSQNN